MLSRGMSDLTCLSTFTDSCATVTGIYMKTDGKNSKYSWTQAIANILGAAMIHVQLFRHTLRDCYSAKHNPRDAKVRGYPSMAVPMCGFNANVFWQWGTINGMANGCKPCSLDLRLPSQHSRNSCWGPPRCDCSVTLYQPFHLPRQHLLVIDRIV